MSTNIKGKAILSALTELREPSTFAEIVTYVAKKQGQPREKLEKLVKVALEAGVRFGYLEMCRNYYYTIDDAVDALEDDSDAPTEAESMANIGFWQKYCAANRKSNVPPKKVTVSNRNESSKGNDNDDKEFEDEDDEEDEEVDEDDDELDSPDEALDAVPYIQSSQRCSYDCSACRKRSQKTVNRHAPARKRCR